MRDRFNARQFISWIQDVDDKYDRMKVSRPAAAMQWWSGGSGEGVYMICVCVFTLCPPPPPSNRRVCWCGSSTRQRRSTQCKGWSGSWRCKSWTQRGTSPSASTKCRPSTCQWSMSTTTLSCCLRDTAALTDREQNFVWITSSQRDFVEQNEWKGLASLSEDFR